MILLLGVPTPPRLPAQKLCAEWEAGLARQLDESQRAHLARFGSGAMHWKMQRMAIRRALLEHLPEASCIGGAVPQPHAGSHALAFSYTESMAFCAADPHKRQFAIDALGNDFQADAAWVMLGRILPGLKNSARPSPAGVARLWMAWEVCSKLDARTALTADALAQICDLRRKLAQAAQVTLLYTRFLSTVVCIGLPAAKAWPRLCKIRLPLPKVASINPGS